MEHVAYIVTATLPDRPTLERYVRWLTEGHVKQVVAAGALDAKVVVVSEPPVPLRVQTIYTFAGPETLARYLAEKAPALRAEGLRQFGPELGVGFERSVGRVIAQVTA